MGDNVRPVIVTLCGSTRFMQAFQDANLQETLAGKIVLTVGCDTKSDAMLGLDDDVKAMLDQLHLAKIDLSDEILVLNVDGYIGESTSGEISHAMRTCKLVRWLEPCDFHVFEVGGDQGVCHCGSLIRWLRFDESGRVRGGCDRHAWVTAAREVAA